MSPLPFSKSKRGVMALAISLIMLIGGFALIAPMEEADAAGYEASLSFEGNSLGTGTLTEMLASYNSQSEAGDYVIEIHEDITGDLNYDIYQADSGNPEKNLILGGTDENNVKTVNGHFTIWGRSNNPLLDDTLTIQYLNIISNDTTAVESYEIENTDQRYAHDVTFKGCSFTSNGTDFTVYFRQAYDITFQDCTVEGGFGFLEGTGIQGLVVTGCSIDSTRGLNVNTSTDIVIEDSSIEAEGKYGLRMNANGTQTVEIRDSSIIATDPIILRACGSTTNYTIYATGDSTIESTVEGRPWFVADEGSSYGEDSPTPPEHDNKYVDLVVTSPNVDVTNVHGASVPTDKVAIVEGPNGTTSHTSVQSAFDAVSDVNQPAGDYTITLLKKVEALGTNNIIKQRAGVNVVIDGSGLEFHSQIEIYGSARHTGPETLKIQNVIFTGEINAIVDYKNVGGSSVPVYSLDYIHSNKTTSEARYAHNVTIEDCTFNMPAGDYVSMRFRQAFNIQVIGCIVSGGHSAFWGTGGTNLGFVGLEVSNVVEGGLSIGTTGGDISVERCTITGAQYAVRADAGLAGGTANLSITDCDFTANVPVTIRYTPTGTYNVTLDSDTTMTPNNPENYWIVASDTAYYGDAGTTPSSSKEVNVTAPSTVPVFVHEHITSCVDTVCGCGEPITGDGHQYDTSATCIARTCNVCTTHTEPADTVNPVHDWDSQYSCCAEECQQCHIAYPTPTDHESDATFPCMDGVCETCGMDMPADSDHTPDSTYPCKVTKCTVCLTSLDADLCSRMNDDPCVDSECMYCGDEMPATADHMFSSTATCINRVCSVCDTTTLATTDHDYRISGHQKVCSMCGDAVNLPIQEDDDDDWYDWWLAQQAAKAEAERLAQEQAEEEEKKKVAAVAVAVGAAVAMVLLLMTTPRN